MSQHIDGFKWIYQDSGGIDIQDIRDSDSGRTDEYVFIGKGLSKGSFEGAVYFEEKDDLLINRIRLLKIPEFPEDISERYLEKVYLSKLDNTEQPYIVKLPEKNDEEKKYPLIVFLHGGGGTEKDIYLTPFFFLDDFFGLSLNGRGPFTDYCYDNAQEDIAESIAEVIKDYPVDQENIILCGASMGGFGVFRTFYETPERFKAVASFAGAPKGHYAGPEQPDFLKAKFLNNFKGLYIFIFHQTHDPNCLYKMVKKSVKRYRENGAIFEFITEDTVGHGVPNNKENITAYHDWLRKMVRLEKNQNIK